MGVLVRPGLRRGNPKAEGRDGTADTFEWRQHLLPRKGEALGSSVDQTSLSPRETPEPKTPGDRDRA